MNRLLACLGFQQKRTSNLFTRLTNECVQATGSMNDSIKNQIQNYLTKKIFRSIDQPVTSMNHTPIDFDNFFQTFAVHLQEVYSRSSEDDRNERIENFLKEALNAVTYSATQCLRRVRRDFYQPLNLISITSGDLHNNSMPWVVSVGEEILVYKPRSLKIDAMVVKSFEDINKKLQEDHLNTHRIRCMSDKDGEYGYAEFVHGKTYHTTSSHLTGFLTPFYEELIDILNNYSIEEDDVQPQKAIIDYLLLDKVGVEFGISWDWHHENFIFNEEFLQATPIDLEVVDISHPGPAMLSRHLDDQIEEYVKERFTDANERTQNKNLLIEKASYIAKKVDEGYRRANLDSIRKEFFLKIYIEDPTIRCVPVGTATFHSLIFQYPPKYRLYLIQLAVASAFGQKNLENFVVDGTKWNQDFVRNKIFKNLSTINIPIFQKRVRMEDGNQIEEVLCCNEVIAKRQEF